LFGWLEFNLALLKAFGIEYVFVVRGGFEVHEEHRQGELGETVLDVVYVGDGMPCNCVHI
jgi:hypothetical protein